MKLVKYDPLYKRPIRLCFPALMRPQSISLYSAWQLYEELGEILKKIPPEKHEAIRLGPDSSTDY